jgi:hypothetical protein
MMAGLDELMRVIRYEIKIIIAAPTNKKIDKHNGNHGITFLPAVFHRPEPTIRYTCTPQDNVPQPFVVRTGLR